MELTCSSCQTRYRIADEKVPARGAKAHCPNCGQWILIPPRKDPQRIPDAPLLRPVTDYGQTIAYDFSEVGQSSSEAGLLLEEISKQDPFFLAGVSYAFKEVETGRELPLEKPELILGRSQGDISLGDPEVSRRHCLVKVFGDRFVIIDLDSTNGTFFGGRKVKMARMGAGERFRVGNTILETRTGSRGGGAS